MLRSLHTSLQPRIISYYKKHGFNKEDFFADTIAGLAVAIVALPLAMAIAIASNLPPERGLFTAIVAGFLISAHGGSRYQIGGPTAAFIVTVAMVAMKHGYDGLVLATIMAGGILMLMAFFRAGEMIKFIPYPVIVGFTSGIALLIAFSQIRDFFGLTITTIPPDFIHKLTVYIEHLQTTNPFAILVALASVAIILLAKRFIPKIPGPIIVVVLSGFAVWAFNIPVETIETRFGAIPSMLPTPTWPEITFEKLRLLLPDAITIATLAAIESLLSAVVADGMTGTKHKSNAELLGQGIANIASGIFGGLPATGAIARTATNIKAGARSPLAGMMHALWLFVFMFFLAPLIIKIPLAALAAILMIVAWNMSEIKHVREIMYAPRSDRVVLILTFLLTVLVDLNFAIQAGIALASILFIDQMMKQTQIRSVDTEEDDPDSIQNKSIPKGVEVYEIQGPLFFGVAEKLLDTLLLFEKPSKIFILRMRYVPLIDAAGLHALEVLHERLSHKDTVLILSGVNPHVRQLLQKANLITIIGEEKIVDHIDKALIVTREILENIK
ncbi:MAG: SulP family inorganic anion transporter [Sulfuricurvum sp.]|uniref:SulP family inorganic anion transporter n=1 Tax=Sulfuricurvum sp. TaxID=2025608 RepID=UPI0026152850|nr:SulP family inorganic anion transporter [Sulfuricurvum sp.]MDD2829154.1 SulP family inorganic anion transporter [Sulfuricurvum sp.]MDD4950203.1 SulP family inorganic anion transporter [Sulfuricurvum sp.]